MTKPYHLLWLLLLFIHDAPLLNSLDALKQPKKAEIVNPSLISLKLVEKVELKLDSRRKGLPANVWFLRHYYCRY